MLTKVDIFNGLLLKKKKKYCWIKNGGQHSSSWTSHSQIVYVTSEVETSNDMVYLFWSMNMEDDSKEKKKKKKLYSDATSTYC